MVRPARAPRHGGGPQGRGPRSPSSRSAKRTPPVQRKASHFPRTGRRVGAVSPRAAQDPMQVPLRQAVPIDISFGNFEFQDMQRVGQRGGGVRELSTLLRHARRQAATRSDLLRSKEGVEQRNASLLSTAVQRASGLKVRDDPQKLAKSLAKRRSKKRQSAKRWAQRLQKLEESVENVVQDRSAHRQTVRARKEAKQNAKAQRKAAGRPTQKGNGTHKTQAGARGKGAKGGGAGKKPKTTKRG